jgi:HlyD family secretion protein
MTSPTPTVASPSNPKPVDVQGILGDEQPRHWWSRPLLWIIVVLLVLAAAGLAYWQTQKDSNAQPTYVTEVIKKGQPDADSGCQWHPATHPCSQYWQ